MKIIEALKEVKRLEVKITDLTAKIRKYSADVDFEQPYYGTVETQKEMLASWLQSVHDTLKEATRLRLAIQETNLATVTQITLGGIPVLHSISEWIIRRRLYAEMELAPWNAMTMREVKEGKVKTSTGDQITVKARYYFDPIKRDKMVTMFKEEPGIIDSTLEVVNATTDLIETTRDDSA